MMRDLDLDALQAQLAGTPLQDWACELPGQLDAKLAIGHGDLPRWYGAVQALPDLLVSEVELVQRFTFGGEAPKDQRVYYFNTKELVGNKYGTPSPVPFRVVDQRAGIDIDIGIRCFGEYSYRIANPLLFYTNVCGNVTEDYTRITEFKYLTGQETDKTTIMKEYSKAYTPGSGETPYYAILEPENRELYERYLERVQNLTNFHPVGRLAEYRYYDMDAVTNSALDLSDEIIACHA